MKSVTFPSASPFPAPSLFPIAAGVLLLSALLFSTLAKADPKQPNIVIFLIDDMGYADCGFNGGTDIRTPNIDRLAKRGAILTSHYVQPLCSTTRATLLTGRLPVHHGIYGALKTDSKGGLPLDETTLAQSLKAAGYTTAITGKWHLGEHLPDYRPTRRGFDHQYGLWYGQIDYFTHERAGRVDWYRDDQPLKEEGYSTTLIGKEAVRLIEAQPKDKPLFLYVPFNGVHGPFQVPEKYLEPYGSLPPKRRTLAGMLSVVDEAIGGITEALRQRGQEDNTVVVFSSDNGGVQPGTVTSNGPLRAGKGTIYEGGIRSAAFVVWPGKVKPDSRIDVPVHVSDWYPTLLGIVGKKVEQPLQPDGLDISPLLAEGRVPTREALLVGSLPDRIALRAGDWKLLRFAGQRAAGKPRLELYNLKEDLSEKHDLAAMHPEKIAELLPVLEERIRDARPSQAGDPAGRRAAGNEE